MHEPQILLFILNIAGTAALLIWSVRLVRTGVERAFATELRQVLRRSTSGRVLAATTGLGAAVALQSSTAVAILVSNFVSKGGLAATAGLAILLGADVGSAIVAQLLLVRQTWLIPLLLLVGVALFMRGEGRRTRPVGRILIGLALIFASLDMIRAATAPLMDSTGTIAAMQYLGGDPLTAFVIGAVFAWMVHSSVAAVLLFVTLVGQGLLPASAAAAMVLGANLGGGFIAYMLTLAAPVTARRIVAANLGLRGSGALLVLAVLIVQGFALDWLGAKDARQVINLHLVFNLGLAVVGLAFLGPVSTLAARLLPDRTDPSGRLAMPGALDEATLDRPDRALDSAAREVLRMGELIETMLRAAGPLFETWDEPTAEAIRNRDRQVSRMHFALKLFLAKINRQQLDEEQSRRAMDLASIAINLEAASDIVTRTMLDLARRLHVDGIAFSAKGGREIGDFHDRVLTNVQLALNVMMTQDPDAARELVAAKDKVRAVEQHLQRQHLGRLMDALTDSIETSNIHQETLRALKQINTAFSMIGYSILARTGDLLSSRLSSAAGD
ncbi:Na/Pi cotransporter family protein [Jannaschia rubra]|uniref:Na/Pi-cotransporter II-related protein n=1 Tax=Jannaschia rubra TaxID=282197 RepID=A0A0M6XKV6_9RHOB|nr:Na/Pi cotransporter family protein [Jannaschia rubra]CTQ31302.1 Na/Pi-cotransporter II-related protein [Jannaschia rubra]SFF82072.1 phosphate:Na+ symporter [Jannaschia rubra]